MPKVVIVGAGISGLVTGILLERLKEQNIDVTIVDQRDKIHSIGGALSIWPNGSKVLLSLPCAAEIQKLAGPLKEERWGNDKGETLRIVNRDLLLEINGFPFMSVCRSELQEVLLNHFGRDKVVYGAKVINIEQTDKEVRLYFNNKQCISADYVIGADGTFSTIRRLLFPTAPSIEYAGYVALVGICKFSKENKPKNHIIWGKSRLLITSPISGDRDFIYTICPLPKGILKNKNLDQKFQLFYGWSDEVDKILTILRKSLGNPEFSSHFFCNENYDLPLLPSFHKGRIALVGDTQAMGSIMGLATNKALENAQALAEAFREENIEAGLKKFSLKQIARVAPMLSLEKSKKDFLLTATDELYVDFKKFLKTASNKEFFGPLFSALKQNTTSTVLIHKKLPLLPMQNDRKESIIKKIEVKGDKPALWNKSNNLIHEVFSETNHSIVMRSRL